MPSIKSKIITGVKISSTFSDLSIGEAFSLPSQDLKVYLKIGYAADNINAIVLNGTVGDSTRKHINSDSIILKVEATLTAQIIGD